MESLRKSPTGQAGQILYQGQDKGKQNPLTFQEIFRRAKSQRTKLVLALDNAGKPLSMRQLEVLTGIERPTICRRISELQEVGTVYIDHYGICPISKYPKVGYYAKRSTSVNGQASLF